MPESIILQMKIRSILEQAPIYDLFQWLVGAHRSRKKVIEQFARPDEGMKILDIGCGSGKIIEYLPGTVQYYGFDYNKNYIDHANRKYGSRGTFIWSNVNDTHALPGLWPF